MSRRTVPESLFEQIKDGCYAGFEQTQIRWLWVRIPDMYRDSDELAAEIRMYSLEAAKMFDPSKGASFTTFLTHHLRLRTQAWQQYLWQRSPKAKNGATVSVPSFDAKDIQSEAAVRMRDASISPARIAQANEFTQSAPDDVRPALEKLLLLIEERGTDFVRKIVNSFCSARGKRQRVSKAISLGEFETAYMYLLASREVDASWPLVPARFRNSRTRQEAVNETRRAVTASLRAYRPAASERSVDHFIECEIRRCLDKWLASFRWIRRSPLKVA